MDSLNKLQLWFSNLGWFSGRKTLTITISSEFEGFSGRASEDWESQVRIQIDEIVNDKGEVVSPAIKIVGLPNEDIYKVAAKALRMIEIFPAGIKKDK